MMRPYIGRVMKTIFVSTLLAVVCSAQANVIRGSTPCGEWNTQQQLNSQSQSQNQSAAMSVLVHHAWIMGYLSGVNLTSRVDFLNGAGGEGIFQWLDSYCAANPLNDATEGADALIKVLKSRSR